jgi:transposase
MRNRRTISLDLRERILKAYDDEEASREAVARRFQVSLGMVKKLLQQRRHTGDIAPRHRNSGRKPRILQSHQRQIRSLLSQRPDMTLEELREVLALDCTPQAIHVVLVKMGLTYKKRLCEPANKIESTSRRLVKNGVASKADSTRRD